MQSERPFVFFCILLLCLTGMAAGQSRLAGASISPDEFMQRLQSKDQVMIIDVRTINEFGMGHIPGAINIPLFDLANRLDEIRKQQQKDIILYCESGMRAGMAERVMRKEGIENILNLEGHMSVWRKSKRPIEKND